LDVIKNFKKEIKMKLSITSIVFAAALFISGCSENLVTPGSDNVFKAGKEADLVNYYNVSMTVYQYANFWPNGEDESYQVVLENLHVEQEFSTAGYTDWAGFDTYPQTWSDANGTYEHIKFVFEYSCIWQNANGCHWMGMHQIGSEGSSNYDIYDKPIPTCPVGSGNVTYTVDPATLLSTSTIYCARIGVDYIVGEEDKK
jgi:hypothetical protein